MKLLFIIVVTLLGAKSSTNEPIKVQTRESPFSPSLGLENDKNLTIDSATLKSFSSARSVFVFKCLVVRIDKDAFETFTNMTDFMFSLNSGVNTLPADIFHANYYLQNIFLVKNNFTHLENGIFSKLFNLKRLDVSMNQISVLSPDIFNSTMMLNSFLIQRNDLKEIPDEIFDNLSQLKLVDLSFNKIRKISAGLFKYNYQLETVNLQGNKIKHLDYGIEHLNVKTFNLHTNPLDMDNKKVLEVLKYLHSNGVTTGIRIPHHQHTIQHENFTSPSNYLLVILISVTVLLSVLVGYLIYVVHTPKHRNCMKYHNMQTLSREDLVADDPWRETRIITVNDNHSQL